MAIVEGNFELITNSDVEAILQEVEKLFGDVIEYNQKEGII